MFIIYKWCYLFKKSFNTLEIMNLFKKTLSALKNTQNNIRKVFSNVTSFSKLNEEVNFPGYNNTQLTLIKNGNERNRLIFSSDRPGGYGKMDLWTVEIDKNGDAEKAINLGSIVNTPGDELTPTYFDSSKVLYFSSDWHAGLGGLDVFSTRYNKDTEEYSRPKKSILEEFQHNNITTNTMQYLIVLLSYP